MLAGGSCKARLMAVLVLRAPLLLGRNLLRAQRTATAVLFAPLGTRRQTTRLISPLIRALLSRRIVPTTTTVAALHSRVLGAPLPGCLSRHRFQRAPVQRQHAPQQSAVTLATRWQTHNRSLALQLVTQCLYAIRATSVQAGPLATLEIHARRAQL